MKPEQPVRPPEAPVPAPCILVRGLQDDRGVAFLLALIALSLMGLMVSAGFYSARQELLMGSASANGSRAYYLAEDAAYETLESWRGDVLGRMPVGSAVTRVDTVPEGIVRVDLRRTADRLYFLEAEALLTRGGAGVLARRNAGMTIRLAQPAFEGEAAVVVAGDVTVTGTGDIDGNDHLPPAWGGACVAAATDRIGLLTASGASVSISDQTRLSGAPPTRSDPGLDSVAVLDDMGDLTWSQLVDAADKVSPGGDRPGPAPTTTGAGGICDEGAPGNWGDPSNPDSPCGGYFPVVHATTDLALLGPGTGQGILLVDGDLWVGGGFRYYGLVIVRGTLTMAGSANTVFGNVRVGELSIDSPAAINRSGVRRSSCAVVRAIAGSSRLTRAIPLSARSRVDLSSVRP